MLQLSNILLCRMVCGSIDKVLIESFTHIVLDKEARTQLQSQEKKVSDLRIQTSLPPHVDGSVHAILICHVPKLRWGAKYQSLYRSVTVKMAWWGENTASAVFK